MSFWLIIQMIPTFIQIIREILALIRALPKSQRAVETEKLRREILPRFKRKADVSSLGEDLRKYKADLAEKVAARENLI